MTDVAITERKKGYNKYISSFAWFEKRNAALLAASYTCQKCGAKMGDKDVKLHVHHLTYIRFRKERPEDLQVVCDICHWLADAEREQVVRQENRNKLYQARLTGWADKVYGEDGYDYGDMEDIEEEFNDWRADQDWDE